MRSRDCPHCGYHFGPRRYMRIRTPLGFACPSCGARLEVRLGPMMGAIAVQAVLMSAVLTGGFHHPWIFALFPVAAVLSFLVQYALFTVRTASSGSMDH